MTDINIQIGRMPPDKRRYALPNLPAHLSQAGQTNRLHRLLTSFPFMESNVSALGPQRMIEDYGLPGVAEDGVSRDGTKDDADHLRLIQESIRMSADVVAEDRTQLTGQLLGRLPTAGIPKVQAMLEQARHWAGTL